MNKFICLDLDDFIVKEPPFRVKKIYDIHDNGARSFRVYISDQLLVRVFRLESNEENIDYVESELVLEANPEKIWIGKSPADNLTNTSDPFFDGNTILLHISGKRYILIGMYIFMFESFYPIIEFSSPVYGSDVPYPYAIDMEDNFYLMFQSIFKNNTGGKIECPFKYFNQANLITPDMGRIPPQQPLFKQFQGVIKWLIDGYQATMRYDQDPEKNYDRLTNNNKVKMHVKKVDQNELVELSKEDYINLMKNFGNEMGFIPLERKTIAKRSF